MLAVSGGEGLTRSPSHVTSNFTSIHYCFMCMYIQIHKLSYQCEIILKRGSSACRLAPALCVHTQCPYMIASCVRIHRFTRYHTNKEREQRFSAGSRTLCAHRKSIHSCFVCMYTRIHNVSYQYEITVKRRSSACRLAPVICVHTQGQYITKVASCVCIRRLISCHTRMKYQQRGTHNVHTLFFMCIYIHIDCYCAVLAADFASTVLRKAQVFRSAPRTLLSPLALC